MKTPKENKWQKEARRSDLRSLVMLFFTVAAISAAVTSWGLYVDRVNASRLIVNCGSFTSMDDATTFANTHTQYKKRLNPKNKPEVCSSYNYGN